MLLRFWVRNFRNLEEQLVMVSPGVTVILGDNNQGKTNFLEAIYFAGCGRSISSEKIEDLKPYSGGEGRLALEISQGDSVTRIYRDMSDRRALSDGKVLSKASCSHLITPLYWSADIIRGFQESADCRRSVLDQMCVSMDLNFSKVLTAYSRVLTQRNAALKSKSSQLIELYTPPLVDLSAQILDKRIDALAIVFDKINRFLEPLFGDKLFDLVAIMKTKGIDISHYKDQLTAKLDQARDKEFALGYTSLGAHRDDFDVLFNNRSVIQFLSRGISRVLAILIQLSILELWGASSPIILIDDAFCEISGDLKKSLGDLIFSKYQSVYVTTDYADSNRFSQDGFFVMREGLLSHETH